MKGRRDFETGHAWPALFAHLGKRSGIAIVSAALLSLVGSTGPESLAASEFRQTDSPGERMGRWVFVLSDGAASPRRAHTAVWTGREMIVWGGNGPHGPNGLADGGRYDPALNQWTLLSEVNAPGRRVNHAAVWTGTEMIVWGGQGPDRPTERIGPYLDGGRYNPASDRWTPISPAPLSPRYGSSVVWTGSELIVWGGLGSDAGQAVYLDDGARYLAASNQWIPFRGDGAPRGRYRHTAVWTGSEMIVWGGSTEASHPLDDGARYDPVVDRWCPIASDGAPSARSLHIAVWTGAEMIIWGGPAGLRNIGDGARYDPLADKWVPISTDGAPTARYQHTMVWDGVEVLVWGGTALVNPGPHTRGSPSPLRTDAASYDPSLDVWRPIASENAPTPRRLHTAVWTGDEMIVWGGTAGATFDDGGRYLPIASVELIQ